MKRVLVVQVSVTENDLLRYMHTLEHSLSNLLRFTAVNVKILLVLQSSSSTPVVPGFILKNDKVCVKRTSRFSVSVARNLGISYARSIGASHIIFHDSSICVSAEFAKFTEICIIKNFAVGSGVIQWGESALKKVRDVDTIRITRTRPSALKNPYVYTYIFRIDILGSINFCEWLGPGAATLFNAGEDVVFLTKLFAPLGKGKLIMHCSDALVFHPPRPADGSKHLAYAHAQGALVRWLVRPENLSLQVFLYFFLFFGNALIRAVLRKTWREILLLRLRGFLSSKTFHQLVN